MARPRRWHGDAHAGRACARSPPSSARVWCCRAVRQRTPARRPINSGPPPIRWLLTGLIIGGLATHWWERRQAASEIAALTARQTDQLREAQARLDELRHQLNEEREQRQALEQIIAALRKRS
jgi:hypothetical protein